MRLAQIYSRIVIRVIDFIKRKPTIYTALGIFLLAFLYISVFRPATESQNVNEVNKAMRDRTLLLFNKGQVKEILTDLENLDDRLKSDIEVKTALAFAYRAAGKKIESFKKYEEILSYDPNNAGTHLRLGIYYRIDKNLKRSREHLEKAVNLQRSPQFMKELAKTYEALGQSDKAGILSRDADKISNRKK